MSAESTKFRFSYYSDPEYGTWACPECEKGYAYYGSLLRHTVRVHGYKWLDNKSVYKPMEASDE
jgi:uncharacterized C2H2 Zn-finger protein